MIRDVVVPLERELSLEAGGGKAMNLARLARADFPVPPGFVITTCAYREYVSANGFEEWLLDTARGARLDNAAELGATSAAIRARFEAGTMSPLLADAIRNSYAAFARPPVAVRSSATTEDLPDLSFAGQQDTKLHVIGVAALLEAVVQCWSSLWTARAIAYRGQNGIAHEDAALAVIVQQMIESNISGVLFTANPLTGKRLETVIEATFGLGEALVSGRVEPDRYVVDVAAGRVLERQIGAKAFSIRPRTEGGTVESQEEAAGRATLTDAAALELAALGQRVATLFDEPQDVEWAEAAGQFYLLQARPITSLFPLPEQLSAEGLRVLLSIGAIQGMLDPFTPLGRDAFSMALARVLATVIRAFAHDRAGPIAVASERLFLDVTPLVRSPRTRSLVQSALGAVEPSTGEALNAALSEVSFTTVERRPSRRVPSPRLLALVSRVLGNLTYDMLWPHRGRARIQRRLAAVIDDFERRSTVAQSLTERVALLEDLFRELPRSLIPVLAAGLVTGLANLRLLRSIAAELPEGERRVLELTRGLPHNVTTEMDLALWGAARAIRSDGNAAAHFRTADAETLARDTIAGRLPRAAQDAIDGFLRRYGLRGVGEIDLGRPRWRDDPTPLIQVLQSYLRIDNDDRAPDAIFRRGAEAAERTLVSLIADIRRTSFGRLKGFVMRLAARRMRALAGLRESPKFTIVRMLGAVRAGLRASGQELVASGILEASEDIFFLHIDELEAVAQGGDAREWRELVRERRKTYAREQRRRRVPRVLLSDGRALYGDTSGEPSLGPTLAGTPVSPGVCVGVARVVHDPRTVQLTPGDILVCRGTDPAWTPLFLAAAGLVTEVGGLMTHGAVVAREYGIPAVVGVRDATARLRTGDRVRVDGTRGSVTILTA